MTERNTTQPRGGNAPSQNAGRSLSVLQRMYRDAERRQAVADRIRQLWEESGHTEPEIADAIGVSLSGYQKQKATGGISREKGEALAKFHGVDYEWIATGRSKGKTPDALSALNGGSVPKQLQDQLDRIEAMLAQLVSGQAELGGEGEGTPLRDSRLLEQDGQRDEQAPDERDADEEGH